MPDSTNKWFGKGLCRDRRACADCRTSAKFRESLHRAGLVDSPDFSCPHGYTADRLPLGLGDVVAKVTTALGIRPCGACKKRQRALNAVRIR